MDTQIDRTFRCGSGSPLGGDQERIGRRSERALKRKEMRMTVEKLRRGEPVAGTMIRMIRNPAIALTAANAGLDFIMFDMEHGSYDFQTIADASSMARARGLDCFVRVPELSKGNVSRALDCGVTGVMVPMIKDAEDAKLLAGWAKYAPTGVRGFGGSGAHTGYADAGGRAVAFMAEENPRVLAIAQIELACAVEDVDAIAAVDGIDALLIGPADLSISLGVPGDFNHPKMDEAIGKVAAAAKKHGKVFGMHAGDALLRKWIPKGLTLRMSLMDINMLLKAMGEVAKLRDIV
jgi:2-keto-3-deoxy-L-rhamnonate aldolase RhmA